MAGSAYEQVGLIGLCIDSHGEIPREDIPGFLLKQSSNDIIKLIKSIKRLAGKYVILYENKYGIYVIPDATGTLQVCYNASSAKGFCIASSDKLISDYYNYLPSERNLSIRLASDFQQPMPNDITIYDEIKVLLPNHYLHMRGSINVIPYMPDQVTCRNCDTDVLINDSIKLIGNIVEEYKKYYNLICPLTAGYDSRVVLAFLKQRIKEIKCFTFNHMETASQRGDVTTAQKLCDRYMVKWEMIDTLKAPVEYILDVKTYLGEFQKIRTINIAYTLESCLKGFTIINGDIIGTIGKSSLGMALPDFFAVPSFFIAKQHNFSKYVRSETKKYLESVKTRNSTISKFELFGIENRLGRWAAQTSNIYSICGINSLNIFNCGELIDIWISIPRKKRNKKIVPKTILMKLAPELLEYPFNPMSKVGWMSKSSFTFLLGTYIKYIVQKCLFTINNLDKKTKS